MSSVKKIVIYGDSISTTEFGGGGYEAYLRERFDAEVINYAISASGLSLITPDNTLTILEEDANLHEDADLIIVWHGSNEWYWGSEIGQLGNQNRETFLGAVDRAMERIHEKSPNAAVFWLTPIYRYQAPDGCECEGKAYETKNKVGNTMLDYYEAIQKASAYYGFQVIDVRRMSGIHEGNHEKYLQDNVHPNKEGYKKVWKIMEREITEHGFF